MDWYSMVGYLLVGGGCFGLGLWVARVLEDRREERRRGLRRRIVKLPTGEGRPKVPANVVLGENHYGK